MPMPSQYKVALTNLGCRVNRVELDAIASELIDAGCSVVAPEDAQLVVINTCAVTAEAEAKARKAVRHAANLAQSPLVVATGCVASLFSDELEGLHENIFVERSKNNVAKYALELLSRLARVEPDVDSAPCESVLAVTPTGRMRPGLKIQDGCDNRCTYCIVWKARGKATSVDPSVVLEKAQKLIDSGAKEIVLTGIDLGRYECAGTNLATLLKVLLDNTEVGRLRLGSIEPDGVTPELLELMASSEGRIAPFLHIPLQSGCDATLKRMGRTYTVADYCSVVDSARLAIPHIAIACDLIVGFPSESEAEFLTSYRTCRDLQFANMHVFRYSKRPGTPAAQMATQIVPEVSARRSKMMRELSARLRHAYAKSLVGHEQLVLVEGKGLGTAGSLVECLVDEGHNGELLKLIPHAVTSNGLLDTRSSL